MRLFGLPTLLVAVAATSPARAAEEQAPFYAESEFWVAVAFVIFIAALYRPVSRAITGALDDRAGAIKAELDEAQRLREEAQHTLAEYQRKQRDALQEAEAILAEAREEAGRIEQAGAARTEETLKRREQQALDMIAAAEAQTVAEVRGLATDVAIEATRRLLADAVAAGKDEALIDAAIKDLPEKLH